jgi:hypothetical protein
MVLSGVAATLHVVSRPEGCRASGVHWLLTGGFTTLTAILLFVTPQQPIGRRGIWVAALSVFAVSALHFGRHSGNESWWVELIGHHASLPLALAILHQGYRFALADLFLKNAIALLLFMGISIAVFSGATAEAPRCATMSGRILLLAATSLFPDQEFNLTMDHIYRTHRVKVDDGSTGFVVFQQRFGR